MPLWIRPRPPTARRSSSNAKRPRALVWEAMCRTLPRFPAEVAHGSMIVVLVVRYPSNYERRSAHERVQPSDEEGREGAQEAQRARRRRHLPLRAQVRGAPCRRDGSRPAAGEGLMTQRIKQSATLATLILACVAQFMVILDVSVVNVALPSIRHGLHFSATSLQWVVNAYTLTFAGFLLLGGRAADLLGRRRLFIAGLLLFAASSFVGGIAPNEGTLIAARAAQGLGGAVVSPATLAIITTTFTEGRARNRALGAWGAMAAAGGTTGALLGGVLTDLVGWRWILFINVPIG